MSNDRIAPSVKFIMEDLTRANYAMMGIGTALNTILRAEEAGTGVNPLAGDNFTKGCLLAGIGALSRYISMRLESMDKMIDQGDLE